MNGSSPALDKTKEGNLIQKKTPHEFDRIPKLSEEAFVTIEIEYFLCGHKCFGYSLINHHIIRKNDGFVRCDLIFYSFEKNSKTMSNTYTQIHIQFVFAVKYRKARLLPSFKVQLLKYITSIIQNNDHKLLAINSEPDHIHIFIGMRPSQSISDLMREVKANSSKWINENNFLPVKFEWQGGYGAFSYKKRDVKGVIDYIQKQEIHHMKTTFIEEYIEFLKEFEIDFDENYIFKEMI